MEPSLTKEQLVAAATRLLDEGGHRAVTLRALAQAIGVSHNAPYKHFPDKSSLLAAVAEAGFRQMRAAFVETADKAATPLDALRLIVGEYLSFARRFPARYRLLFSDPDISREGGLLEAEALKTFGVVAGLVQAAQEAGQLKAGDVAQMTALIYGAIHGLIDLELSGRAQATKGLANINVLLLDLLDLLAGP